VTALQGGAVGLAMSSIVRKLSVLLSVAGLVVSASSGFAWDQPRIVNGVTSYDFPTTGQLLYGYEVTPPGPINDNNQQSWCSGTLIGCQTFLTASHCVADDPNPTHYRVFLQHAGIFEVTSVTKHPSYTDGGFPEFDVAVLKLATPVTAIDPTEINSSLSPPIGTIATIAGFGRSGGLAEDYGIKRAGLVKTIDCTGLLAGLGNSELVCWDFLNPLGPAGTDSNTCNGDSGGPLFADLGSGEVVAAVTSGGVNGLCMPTDYSYDANVFAYNAFIAAQLGADSTAACGGLPAVGDATVLVGGESATLSSVVPSVSSIVHVTGTPDEVRFALNGQNPAFDVDLYVKEGLGVSTINFDCKADGVSNFADCIFPAPTAGPWSVLVRRYSGSGMYQLTTTIVGGDPPVCGNNLAEFGEECDGTDDAQCLGACDSFCMCPCEERSVGNVKLRSDAGVFRFKGDLDNTNGAFSGIDPRNEFAFAIVQGASVVSIEVPALDPGWYPSRPEKGKFVWKGLIGGINRVKIVDKTLSNGTVRVQVKGKQVPGAASLDLLSPYEIQTYFDTSCNRTNH
jgi:hypothetical protein